MISIRKERPPDVAAREALLDDAFGRPALAQELATPARWPVAGRRPRFRRDGWQARRRYGPAVGHHRAAPAELRSAAWPGRRRPRLPQPRNRRGPRSATRSARRAGRVIARSSSSAMRPTTTVSASRRTRPQPCACPVPSSAIACSPSSSSRARSRAPAGCCVRQPAGFAAAIRRIRSITLAE